MYGKIVAGLNSVNRNKCASWAINDTTTTHYTHCWSWDAPNLNNWWWWEWASNSVSWPYLDWSCARNWWFSATTANWCTSWVWNQDWFCIYSWWSATTGIATTWRYKVNIRVK